MANQKSKVFTGARAKVYVKGELVGLYDSCSWSVNVGAEPAHILGRYSAAEITPTSYEAVTVNCSGFRIIGNGAHVLPKMPKLQDLLNLEAITLHIVDRQDVTDSAKNDGPTVMKVTGCIPVSYSSGVNAKATSRIQITYMGTKHSDEQDDQDESTGATELPSSSANKANSTPVPTA